jgi:alpha-beta hydrolase superfamily lysophospholipase
MDAITTTDGLRLQVQHWPAMAGHRGSVLIVHGLGEHFGRYAHVAAALNAAGWSVSAYDQRGHGRSEGERGVLPRPHDLLIDLARAVDGVRAAHPGPLVLLGHSMGGLVAARFVAEALAAQPAVWSRNVDALVLSSPALDPGLSFMQKSLLGWLGGFAPHMTVGNGLKPVWLSHDLAVVKAYVDDPLTHDQVSARLVRFIVDSGPEVLQQAPRWTTPTLLLWAGADRCVAPAGSAAFAKAAPAAVVTAQVYPEMFHEIFNEPGADAVLARVTAFLATTFPATNFPAPLAATSAAPSTP